MLTSQSRSSRGIERRRDGEQTMIKQKWHCGHSDISVKVCSDISLHIYVSLNISTHRSRYDAFLNTYMYVANAD